MRTREMLLDPKAGRSAHFGGPLAMIVARLNGACDRIGVPGTSEQAFPAGGDASVAPVPAQVITGNPRTSPRSAIGTPSFIERDFGEDSSRED